MGTGREGRRRQIKNKGGFVVSTPPILPVLICSEWAIRRRRTHVSIDSADPRPVPGQEMGVVNRVLPPDGGYGDHLSILQS